MGRDSGDRNRDCHYANLAHGRISIWDGILSLASRLRDGHLCRGCQLAIPRYTAYLEILDWHFSHRRRWNYDLCVEKTSRKHSRNFPNAGSARKTAALRDCYTEMTSNLSFEVISVYTIAFPIETLADYARGLLLSDFRGTFSFAWLVV